VEDLTLALQQIHRRPWEKAHKPFEKYPNTLRDRIQDWLFAIGPARNGGYKSSDPLAPLAMGVAMSVPSSFAEFLARIRAGDGQAAEELVRKYEPLIRREVRLNLEDSRLGRLFDSMDVCQSVLKSFFVRTAAGEYDLDDPSQLVRLLVTMARNKLASEARREHRAKRDNRRLAPGEDVLANVKGNEASPSRIIADRELLDAVRQRLTDDERALADLRGQGNNWEEIAGKVGGNAHARRVQLGRALDRVSRDLGLDEDADE
jgi:RNA polymerase sigma factor (sigma-70 family)